MFLHIFILSLSRSNSLQVALDRIHILFAGADAVQRASKCNVLWLFSRWQSSNTDQEVPSWAGFVSLTGEVPRQTTTIDYYPVINYPITDNKTVLQCLLNSESATKEVGQECVITTFDLGVCMKV